MFHFVYLLESVNSQKHYVGYTIDLKKRLQEHNRGFSFATKPYMPWRLIFFEGYLHKQDALRREKYFKTSQGMRLIKRMVKEYIYHKNN